MRWTWWIALGLLALTLVLALAGLLAWLVSGNDRCRHFARASGRWSVVVMLGVAVIVIFSDLIHTLLSEG